jgi:hypothetical protein
LNEIVAYHSGIFDTSIEEILKLSRFGLSLIGLNLGYSDWTLIIGLEAMTFHQI